MNKSPKISIVTPSYNSGEYLEEAIQSILNQDYENWEHIIVDGGSSDKTVDILEKYSHLEVVREPDEGIYDALNKGIKKSDGDLVGWLNADDIFAEGVFGDYIEMYNDTLEGDIFIGNADIFKDVEGHREQINKYTEIGLKDAKYGVLNINAVMLNSCLFTREILTEVGLFNPEMKISGDLEYLIRLALVEPRTQHVNRVTYRYRSHEDSLTFSSNEKVNIRKEMYEEALEFLPQYIENETIDEEVREFCIDQYRSRTGKLLMIYLRESQLQKALKLLKSVHKIDSRWGWFVMIKWLQRTQRRSNTEGK